MIVIMLVIIINYCINNNIIIIITYIYIIIISIIMITERLSPAVLELRWELAANSRLAHARYGMHWHVDTALHIVSQAGLNTSHNITLIHT